MLLTIDLGNTNIVFGLFSGKKLVKEWRYPTKNIKLPPIDAGSISAVIIASVVPPLDNKLRKLVKNKLKITPIFVGAKNIPLKVLLKKKGEVGADRLVNALAAFKLYGGPAIVVDFGTATTFDVISAKGEYLGGVIAPGIDLARDALHARTAKLPKVMIRAPKNVIGKDTISAMQSGLVYGYVAMIEGMIYKLKSEISLDSARDKRNPKSEIHVIATGGLAGLICKYTGVVDRIDMKLTLKGLQMIATGRPKGRPARRRGFSPAATYVGFTEV